MGILLSKNELLKSIRRQKIKKIADIKIALHNENKAIPGEDEGVLKVCKKLEKWGDNILEKLKNYQGCTSQVRKAILNPKSDIEKETLIAIKPAVLLITDCYVFTILSQSVMMVLIMKLAHPDIETGSEKSPELMEHLFQFSNFIQEFDRIKSLKPEIQNDFSYYRRTFNANKYNDYKAILPLELTDNILLFFASAYPTITRFRTFIKNKTELEKDLKTIKDKISPIQNRTELTNEATGLSDEIIAVIREFKNMGISMDFQEMRVPVAVITNGITKLLLTGKTGASKKDRRSMKRSVVVMSLIYDELEPDGLIGQNSLVSLKYITKALKNEILNEEESLLSSIRYNGKGLYTVNTPKYYINLLTFKKK